MIALRAASIMAALATIVLNAHGGFTSTKAFEYAVLLAALYAAMDVAKCALLVAASKAWHQRAFGLAVLCVLLWPFFFANSVWTAIQQVAVTRDDTKAERLGATQTRARTDAERDRLINELAILHASPTYMATTACSLPKSKDARTFCERVAAATDAITRTNQQLAATTPIDAEPHVTLLSALTGARPQSVQFTTLLVPVLLAEVLGAVGFYIAARLAPEASQKPATHRSWSWRGWWRSIRKNAPAGDPGASGAVLAEHVPASIPAPTATPTIAWQLPTS